MTIFDIICDPSKLNSKQPQLQRDSGEFSLGLLFPCTSSEGSRSQGSATLNACRGRVSSRGQILVSTSMTFCKNLDSTTTVNFSCLFYCYVLVVDDQQNNPPSRELEESFMDLEHGFKCMQGNPGKFKVRAWPDLLHLGVSCAFLA